MLVLVPSPLSQTTPSLPILAADLPLVHRIRTWAVENAKPARAALAVVGMPVPLHTLSLHEMAKTPPEQRDALLLSASADAPLGLVSDAGCPAIADPGSSWVLRAHQLQVPVQPLVGPCSPVLALMASGLPGQHFMFHGYPPINPAECVAWIQKNQGASGTPACTQIAIETPFRNAKFFKTLIETLNPQALLCLAHDLNGCQQRIHTRSTSAWKKLAQEQHPDTLLGKTPCIFLWCQNP